MLSIYLTGERGENMINIERIRIKGFKNIEKIDLHLNKITSLLSRNSFGKSNVLEGIQFGIEFISSTDLERRRMMSWIEGLPLNKNIEKKEFCFELKLKTEIEKEEYKIIYGYSFSWSANDKNPPKILNESLKIKKTKDTQKYTSYIKRNEQEAYYKTSTTGTCEKKIKIEDQELLINKLKAFDNLYYNGIVKIINNINIYIDRHFDTKNNYDLIPFSIEKDTSISLLKKNNIPRILNSIKEENPNKYEIIINTFKDLFPFIEEIDIKTYKIEPRRRVRENIDEREIFELTKEITYMFIKDKNISQEIPLELMSDGAKRVLMTLTYLAVADMNNFPLIAIEEPENSVHPQLLQKYLIALDSFLENSKIIITSHSPHLVNYIEPSNIYLGIPNNKGLATFSKVKESSSNKLINEANSLNVLSGDYLFDLMSGTEEDIKILSSYVE